METIYRKVAVSERLPNDGITVFMLNEKDEWQANGYLDRGDWFNDFDNECPCFPTHWLEEIPDNTHQIEKLEAEKKELLEGLEKIFKVGYKPCRNTRNEELEIIDIARNLLNKFQKYKQ